MKKTKKNNHIFTAWTNLHYAKFFKNNVKENITRKINKI